MAGYSKDPIKSDSDKAKGAPDVGKKIVGKKPPAEGLLAGSGVVAGYKLGSKFAGKPNATSKSGPAPLGKGANYAMAKKSPSTSAWNFSDSADAAATPTVAGTKRAASTAGYAGTSYKPAPAPEKSAMMSAKVKPATGATSGSITKPSPSYKAAQKQRGDDYLASTDYGLGSAVNSFVNKKKK